MHSADRPPADRSPRGPRSHDRDPAEPLPVLGVANAIVEAIRARRRLVLVAPTGSGKSTAVPPLLLDRLVESGRIVVTQPRRLATRLVAQRVASMRGERLGGVVGFRTRHESAESSATRLRFVTEGLLVREATGADPLRGVSCVILDEFHERNVDADLLLGIVRRLQESTRPDLALVVMSATLEAERVGAWLDAPVVRAEGRAFPVDVRHVSRTAAGALWDDACDATESALAERDGDALVFMPGVFEIGRTVDALRRRLGGSVSVRPLHGSLPPREQDAALAESSQRRVIVATNVAETSITVPGVRVVVDGGLARRHFHDPRRGVNMLAVAPISRASADQRAGRAGRTAPGLCIRLWSAAEHARRDAHDEPEIRRLELSEPILGVLSLGIEPRAFPWLDPPEPAMVDRALTLLRTLGAVDDAGRISDDGRLMADFGVHPRLGRMLVDAAARGCLGRAIRWAALIGDRDIVERPTAPALLEAHPPTGDGETPSDLAARETLLLRAAATPDDHDQWRRAGLAPLAVRDALRTMAQLGSVARRHRLALSAGAPADLRRALLAGFADHLAVRLDARRDDCAMAGQRRLAIDPNSVVRTAGPLVAVEIVAIGRGDQVQTVLSLATAIDPSVLAEALPERIETRVECAWDGTGKAVVSMERTLVDGIEIARTNRPAHGAEASALLAERVIDGTVELANWNDAVTRWIDRVRFVARTMPELGLIDYGDDDRRVLIHEIVGDCVRASQLRDRPCIDFVRNALSWDQQRLIARHAPESLPLPSGRTLKLEYPVGAEADAPPIGRARIQELYGLAETPAVAEGRVKVLLEILGPNRRPVQRTTDLKGFWERLYPQLRAELKRRYPKHEWR